MSDLAVAIRACMVDRTGQREAELRGTFSYPADSILFQGHFPGDAILPAVHMTKTCLLMLEDELAARVRLHEIVTAKFYRPVRPGDSIEYALHLGPQEDGGHRTVQALIASGDERVAKIKMVVATVA